MYAIKNILKLNWNSWQTTLPFWWPEWWTNGASLSYFYTRSDLLTKPRLAFLYEPIICFWIISKSIVHVSKTSESYYSAALVCFTSISLALTRYFYNQFKISAPQSHFVSNRVAVQYRISVRNSSYTQISRNLIHPFQLPNRLKFGTEHGTLLCAKFQSDWINNRKSYVRTIFHEFCVKDEFRTDILHCTRPLNCV